MASNFLVVEQQISLVALGLTGNLIPGVPPVIGPFHYFDARAGVAQNVLDLTNLRNYRASKENVRGTQPSTDDARDLITVAVTGAYLQIISAAARVDSVREADLTRRAAAAERYPTVAVRADYGVIGCPPTQANSTFGVAGQVSFPIFQGGRVHGDIQEARPRWRNGAPSTRI